MKTTASSNVVKLTATQCKAFFNKYLQSGNKIPQTATVLNIDYDSIWFHDCLILIPCVIKVKQELNVNVQVLALLKQLVHADAATPEQVEQFNKLQQGADGECVCVYTLPIDSISDNVENIVASMREVNGGTTPYMVG